ncbi:hypothetical protein BCR42DRAFT_397341 [Absidia repens]|uniref:Uncharacterized protein n=1 Tax=Absidia repens TaxID=90262 RepID=A0A1X2I1Y9_9FUNG|nr:hypothetical protein BCR42DRAFT_397341 [Absidia repens]
MYQISNIYERATYILAVPDLHERYVKEKSVTNSELPLSVKNMSYPDITGHVQATGHTGGDTNWQVTDDQCDAAIWGQVAEKLKDRHDTAYYEAGPLHDHLRNSGFNRIARNPPEKHCMYQDEHTDRDWRKHRTHWQGTRAYDYTVHIDQTVA